MIWLADWSFFDISTANQHQCGKCIYSLRISRLAHKKARLFRSALREQKSINPLPSTCITVGVWVSLSLSTQHYRVMKERPLVLVWVLVWHLPRGRLEQGGACIVTCIIIQSIMASCNPYQTCNEDKYLRTKSSGMPLRSGASFRMGTPLNRRFLQP